VKRRYVRQMFVRNTYSMRARWTASPSRHRVITADKLITATTISMIITRCETTISDNIDFSIRADEDELVA